MQTRARGGGTTQSDAGVSGDAGMSTLICCESHFHATASQHVKVIMREYEMQVGQPGRKGQIPNNIQPPKTHEERKSEQTKSE